MALLLLIPVLNAQLPAGTTDASATQVATTDTLRTQAAEALEKQDYPTAFKLLTTLTAKYPTDAHLFYDLGYVEDARDNDADAVTAYQKSITVDASFLPSHLALGLLLARTGKVTEAHAELTRATALTTDEPALKARAYRALARLDQAADPGAASADLLEALKLSPEGVDDALLAGELAESAKDVVSAEAAYRRILATHAGDPAITAALAHLLLSIRRAAEAETLLTSALEKHPADPILTSQLAATYAAEDKLDDAIALVDKLHTATPADDNLTRLLAHLYSDNKEPAKADPLYNALLIRYPRDVSLLADHGETQFALYDYPGAQATLSRAIASPKAFASPADLGYAASNLAFAASHAGHPEIVLQALSVRATVLPQSSEYLFLAATAHDTLHHSKQASDLYQQFLAAAAGKFPDQEWEASHRLIALQHTK